MDPAYLRQRLRYDPETGKLWWRHYEPRGARWNGRWAGKEAFTAIGSKGYRVGHMDGKHRHAHRVIWAIVHGEWPVEIDHEDHDPSNNRLRNLRETNRTGNGRNQSRSRANTSGVTGVCWCKRHQSWLSRIEVNGRNLHLGYFDDFDAAVAARKAGEIKHAFHPNHGK